MKASAAQIRAAVDAPNPATRLYLLHGPDESGAAELAARLARALGPDAERVDLDMKALREQPGRLADEAASMSLFGGARYIRVTGVRGRRRRGGRAAAGRRASGQSGGCDRPGAQGQRQIGQDSRSRRPLR